MVRETRAQNILKSGDWIYEIKFDGYRALALRGGSESRILSRKEKDLGKKFREVAASIPALDVEDAVIDGEIVALDDNKSRSSFQLFQGVRHGPREAANRIGGSHRQAQWFFGPLLVGFYEGKKLKFLVGTGFTEFLQVPQLDLPVSQFAR